MSEASALLAVGSDFEYEGRKYHLRPFTLGDEAIYEAWLEREAYKAVARQKAWMEPDDYKLALAAVSDGVAAQRYTFMSRLGQESLTSSAGVKQFLLMTLQHANPKPDDPPIDEEFVDKLYNAKLKESVEYIKRANTDPKLKAELRRQRKMARRSAKSL